jgi:hypothetical protein
MRLAIAWGVSVLLVSGAASGVTYNTPVLDGVIGADWPPESVFETLYLDDCPYTLHITWDADFLWIGLESDTCRRFLGDGETDISFFVAIDVDRASWPSFLGDCYGNVQFHGCFLPDYIYYFAGGAGWYEWGHWDPPDFYWLGWRDDNTYYAWDGGGLYDDELGILWSDIGYPAGITVAAWISEEDCFGGCGIRPCPGVLAAWPPENPPANCGHFWWAYPFFMPHIPGPMPLEGFAPNTVPSTNGEATATQASSWGGVKALYR